MIKAKVLIPFTDKATGKKYDKKGAVIELTASRFNEIFRKDNNLIEAYEEPTTKKEK